MTSDLTSPSNRWLALLYSPWPVVALLVCYLALGLSAASRKAVTGDEGTHLLGGATYWADNDYRVNPESGNWIQRWATLPVWLAGYNVPSFEGTHWQQFTEYDLAPKFLFESGNNPDHMLMLGRAMIGLLGVALGVAIYCWSHRLFGPLGGLISLTLFAFSPTMLTHGFLVTADFGLTFFLLTAVGSIWLLAHTVSFGTLLLSCFTLAGLFMSKVSGVTILPMAIVLIVVRLRNPAPLIVALPRRREINGALNKLAVLLGATIVVALGIWFLIWASYGFRYSMLNPSMLKDVEPVIVFQKETGFLNDLGKFAADHHLLPQGYLDGYSYMLSRTQGSSAFFNGEYSTKGWLSFFPYAVAVKTPLECFLILLLAAAAFWRFRRPAAEKPKGKAPSPQAPGMLYNLAPLLVLLAVYWLFALTSHFNIGHRHVLPTYPPLFILAGAAGWWFAPPRETQTAAKIRNTNNNNANPAAAKPFAVARAAIVVALVLSAAEALWFWPHYLAYFNLLIGGPHNAYKHLVDSSLDWSQDVQELQRWFDAHPADVPPAKPVYVSLFGDTWKFYGMKARALPSFLAGWPTEPPQPLEAGTYCISATELNNVLLYPWYGRWNQNYESDYQQLKRNYEIFRQSLSDPALRAKLATMTTEQDLIKMLNIYDRARFARLCAYLRHREPDDEVGYSIMIYRLSDVDLQQALDGPPAELLERAEKLQ